MRQEFHRGDLVRTLPILWNDNGDVRHEAFWGIIVGSYRDQYGGGPDMCHSYSVLQLKKDGQADCRWSWLEAESIDFLVQERCIENLDILDAYESEG